MVGGFGVVVKAGGASLVRSGAEVSADRDRQ